MVTAKLKLICLRKANGLRNINRIYFMRLTQLLTLVLICCVPYTSWASEDDKTHWQQENNYQISADLDTESHTLKGHINIEYTSHSPKAISTIYIHVWPNAYSSKETEFAKQFLENEFTDFAQARTDEMGKIDDLAFQIDGENAKWVYDRKSPDIVKINLRKGLNQGETIVISTPFTVSVPKAFSRMGRANEDYIFTQWYPKPAVFDEEGWNQMPYLDQGEFYAEFGKFEVELTVPSDYTIAATGLLVEEKENGEIKTLKFEQDKIHDFAWFASKNFNRISDEVTLPNGHKVELNTYYLSKDNDAWKKSVIWMKKAVELFSDLIGPYPYDHCTVVQGPIGADAGMEYPMITIVSDVREEKILEEIIVHEIAHNWWYGILASNERKSPWIDEGFTSYYEKRYLEKYGRFETPLYKLSQKKFGKIFGLEDLEVDTEEKMFAASQHRHNTRQAIGTSSEKLTTTNYYSSIYIEAPMAIKYLESYMGQAAFDDMLRSFYEKHKFQLIDGKDLRKHFEEYSGTSLKWFFDDLIYADDNIDIGLKKSMKEKNGYEVTVKNNTNVQMPVPVSGIKDGNVVKTIWTKPFRFETTTFLEGEYDEIIVDINKTIPEANVKNNFLYSEKFFQKRRPIRPKFAYGIENPRKSHLYFMPVIGGNAYDKTMLGVAIYNRVRPAKNFEFELIPMYSFGAKTLVGLTNMSYQHNMDHPRVSAFVLDLQMKRFTYNDKPIEDLFYFKIAPRITMKFDHPEARSKIKHSLSYRLIYVGKRDGVLASDQVEPRVFKVAINRIRVNEYQYKFENPLTLMPHSASVTMHQTPYMVRFTADAQAKFHFKIFQQSKFNSAVSVRWFGGAFAYNDIPLVNKANFAISAGGVSGRQDFLMDYYYTGRYKVEGLHSQQYNAAAGGFTNTATFRNIQGSEKWVTTVNLKFSPIKIGEIFEPKLYMDFGLLRDRVFVGEYNTEKLFDVGASLTFFDNAIAVNLPFYSSKNIRDINAAYGYGERISFTVNLNQLNPHKKIRKLDQ